MKAMILAAGFGTRLFPLTIDRTKPAIPFLGKPLVGYVAEYLAEFGFREIVVNLHHQPDSVIAALGDGSQFGVKINYSIEQPAILGTSGALDHARQLLGDETFLVINGKLITDIDLAAAIETHRSSGAIATMVLKPNVARERFTEVFTSENRVKGFGGMPSLEASGKSNEPPYMFTGIQILEPRVFDYIPRGVYSDIVPTFYRPAIDAGAVISAHITDGRWFELSTMKRYLEISLAMYDGGGTIVGRRSEIAEPNSVNDTVLWDDVIVEPGAKLERTIVGDGVVIRSGQKFFDSAIVRADMVRNCREIPEKAEPGEFNGDLYVVPLR
ncbi:MAG: NDP-sugar synthase [Acidobacteria bacterium]|nr:NDP-sugar synthase [Acidobacteriota bacterium]